MKRTILVCDFGDILRFAETLGFSWNGAHQILDEFYPVYGSTYVNIDELEEVTEDPDALRIMRGFFEAEGVEEFEIRPKG